MRILGLSSYYHDSAAALLYDGVLISAAQEERFSRRKHDPRFPTEAVRYCLSEAGCTLRDVDYVVFYDKPLLKFERLLETYLAFAPRGLRSFLASMPVWLKEKLFLKTLLRRELAVIGDCDTNALPPLLFTGHHQAHAASAFYASPFQQAAVLCLDGVGEWATTSAWFGRDNRLTPHWQIDFPHSLGLLYSAFTHYTGFRVNSAEYKLMGLAPYGEPRFVKTILDHLIDIKADGTFRLNLRYFGYTAGLAMTNRRFHGLFGGPPRRPESAITQREMDLARSIQVVTEDVVLKLANSLRRELGTDKLCLAGGVALNCVANGRLLRDGPFERIWVQPAAGDAGGAVGAALAVWHQYLEKERTTAQDMMRGTYLGPAYSASEIKACLEREGAVYRRLEQPQLLDEVAGLLQQQHVVGWFQGRMEFGPRALGNRSILADPRSPSMQARLNQKIKFRESFRPFAPAIKVESVAEWFDLDRASPYMSFVATVAEDRRSRLPPDHRAATGLARLHLPRSAVPAVTHVDFSARVQTVHQDTNPRFHALLGAFERRTGCPMLVNTSFNVRGEPIVATPHDAFRCFMATQMDYLVVEDFLLAKHEQPHVNHERYKQIEVEPD